MLSRVVWYKLAEVSGVVSTSETLIRRNISENDHINRLRAFENRVLRRIFVLKTKHVIGC
jgi:hypothetical protein